MFRTAKLSILGLWYADNTIFDNLKLPASLVPMKESITAEILRKAEPFSVTVPDPEELKFFIGSWSDLRISDWNRIDSALNAEYNPIHNYNMTDSTVHKGQDSTTGTSSSTQTGTNSSVSKSKNRAFPSADLVQTSEDSQVDSPNLSAGSEGYSQSSNEFTDTTTRSGNIGVTTSQQMISAELKLRLKTLANIIVDEFISEFCVQVYL